MFEHKTPEAVHEAMMAEMPEDIDKREGSVAHDLLYPPAIEIGNAYIGLDTVLALGFPDTAEGEWLDKLAIPFGVTRKPAVAATGTVTLSGPAGTLVPAGTRLQTQNGVFFTTNLDVILTAGEAITEATAEEGGSNGNVTLGEINALAPGDLQGVVTVVNLQPFEGGVEMEDDASLLQRLKDRAQRPATSGNANHYRQWALEVAGIGNARVHPLADGPGTVKVVLLSTENQAPTAGQVSAAAAHINTEKPVGATVTVVGAEEVEVNITAQLVLAEGTTVTEVQSEFTTLLASYLKSLAFMDPVVRYAKIASLLIDVPGVRDYQDLQVNGEASNLIIAEDAVAVPGAVTFT